MYLSMGKSAFKGEIYKRETVYMYVLIYVVKMDFVYDFIKLL